MNKKELVGGVDESLGQLEIKMQEVPKPEEAKNEVRIVSGSSKDKDFEGSVIIKTEDAQGRVVGYAIRKNKEGELEGNKIGYQSNGEKGAVYQLRQADFEQLKAQGILDSYEHVLAKEGSEKMDEANIALLNVYMEGRFNPWEGTYPDDKLLMPAQKALEGLSSADQEAVAVKFFDGTIGRSISNNKKAYMVYGLLKSSPFGQKFKQLEDARLKDAGYDGGFKL